MTKLTIESVHLDTELAVKSWPLYWHDGSNVHTGKVYLSSAGTWYVDPLAVGERPLVGAVRAGRDPEPVG